MRALILFIDRSVKWRAMVVPIACVCEIPASAPFHLGMCSREHIINIFLVYEYFIDQIIFNSPQASRRPTYGELIDLLKKSEAVSIRLCHSVLKLSKTTLIFELLTLKGFMILSIGLLLQLNPPVKVTVMWLTISNLQEERVGTTSEKHCRYGI